MTYDRMDADTWPPAADELERDERRQSTGLISHINDLCRGRISPPPGQRYGNRGVGFCDGRKNAIGCYTFQDLFTHPYDGDRESDFNGIF